MGKPCQIQVFVVVVEGVEVERVMKLLIVETL
jgi:hypothetical protein